MGSSEWPGVWRGNRQSVSLQGPLQRGPRHPRPSSVDHPETWNRSPLQGEGRQRALPAQRGPTRKTRRAQTQEGVRAVLTPYASVSPSEEVSRQCLYLPGSMRRFRELTRGRVCPGVQHTVGIPRAGQRSRARILLSFEAPATCLPLECGRGSDCSLPTIQAGTEPCGPLPHRPARTAQAWLECRPRLPRGKCCRRETPTRGPQSDNSQARLRLS